MKVLHGIIFGICVSMLIAAPKAWSNSDNGKNSIISAGIHDTGNIMVQLASSSNTEGCTASTKNYILISKTNPNLKEMYATVLLALATGRPISGWTNGCTDVWGTGGGWTVATATTISIAQ